MDHVTIVDLAVLAVVVFCAALLVEIGLRRVRLRLDAIDVRLDGVCIDVEYITADIRRRAKRRAREAAATESQP